MSESAITPLVHKDTRIIINPPTGRVVRRKVLDWSGSCGTYGMGGPGFLGFELEPSAHPLEWLILRLWGATSWLSVNGRPIGAHPDQYDTHRPLESNYAGLKWDEFGPLVKDQTIITFDVRQRSMRLVIGEAEIILDEDAEKRPYHAGSKTPRILQPNDDLRDAWLIAPYPWVRV